jgi:hypothetical protein
MINNNPPPQNPPQYEYRLSMPANELQFNMMITESTWGSPDMSPVIKDELLEGAYLADEKGNLLRDEQGNPVLADVKQGWELFSMYTRDFRLSNLDGSDQEYVDHYTDTAFQLLQERMSASTKTALGYAVTRLETSQSKKGFVRKQANTLTTENINRDIEPAKRRLFSKGGE